MTDGEDEKDVLFANSLQRSNYYENMTLKDALELYKQEERTPSNSYEWYRKSAQRNGTVSIGYTNVPAYKLKGVWCVVSFPKKTSSF